METLKEFLSDLCYLFLCVFVIVFLGSKLIMQKVIKADFSKLDISVAHEIGCKNMLSVLDKPYNEELIKECRNKLEGGGK